MLNSAVAASVVGLPHLALMSMVRLFDAFTTTVKSGGEPLASFARALEVERVIGALYESNVRKAWVEPAAS